MAVLRRAAPAASEAEQGGRASEGPESHCEANRSRTESGFTDSGDASVNLVFIGPCGCGKSTTVGRLVADCGAIDERSLERVEREAVERGQPDRRYSWILDRLRSERERGGTIYTAVWRVVSLQCRFVVIDAPGHGDFAKDTVTATSQADVAVLVVTAVSADLDVGQACEGQIREHTLLAYTLGVRRLVVCVNKMDSEAVAFSKARFDHASAVVREDLRKVGYDASSVIFVPTSGLSGDNVVSESSNMPWYSGPTLLDAMHRVVDDGRRPRPEQPLRVPVREVFQIGGTGTAIVGRIETGVLRLGTQLLFTPGAVVSQVLAIERHHERLECAEQGDSVCVRVDVPMKDLRRGMVASVAGDKAAKQCSSFLAQVIVLTLPRAGAVKSGCVLVVDCHTAQVPCELVELLWRTDRRTGKVLELRPEALRAGDAAVARFRPQAPLCVEPFGEYPPLGRFTVRDQKTTVAVGVVTEVEADSAKGHHMPVMPVAASADAPMPVLQAQRLPSSQPHTRHAPSRSLGETSAAAADADVEAEASGGGTDGSLPRKPLLSRKLPNATAGKALASSPFAAFGDVTKKRETATTMGSTLVKSGWIGASSGVAESTE